MQVIAAIIGIGLAIALYLWLCMLVATFVSVPVVLVAAPLCALAGIGLAITRTAGVLRGRHPATVVVTPQAYATIAAARRARSKRHKHIPVDVAWPHYLVAQVVKDHRAAAKWLADDVGKVWAKVVRPLDGDAIPVVLAFWPLTLIVPLVLIAGSLGAMVGMVAVVAVSALVTAAGWAVGALMVVTARAVGLVWQTVFRARASCPQCFAVTRLPAYRCPGSHPGGDNLHRALLPGRLGIWWRRCACGTRLPTTVFRAHRLQAVCQKCNHPLHEGAGMARDVRIPVFGAVSAGKTHLIMGGLVALDDQATAQLKIAPADPASEKAIREFREVIKGGGAAVKTPVDRPPIAVTTRIEAVGTAWPQTLAHVFDASGEALVSPTRNAEFGYLDLARTLLFVLDPFSIPDVRDQLKISFGELAPQANPASLDPEESYNGTVNRLRGYGVKTSTQKLAFVVSKADLLVQMPIGEGLSATRSTSAAIRDWLCARRLENLVDTAEKDFGEVRFFFVSAKDATRHGALEPFAWLLERDGLKLP